MRNPAVAKASTSKTPCCSKVGIKRGPWTPEEDELLANYIRKEGEGRWRTMPKRAGLLRCGKSCRLRWMNYLRPSVKRGQIAPDEEDLILRLHRLLGNRWSLIAGRIPGRTDNEIKNYWNTHLSKKLISQGIDPRTHKPLNPSPPPTTTTPTTSSQTPHDPAASTSHPNPNPNPKPNPNPNISGLEDRFITIKSCQNLRLTNLDSDEYQNRVLIHNQRTENWQNSDGLMMGNLQSCNHGINNNSNKEDDMGYCNEDMFSSFLNSLINEDVFVNQQPQRQPQPEQPNLIAPVISSHTGVSSVKRFNNGSAAVWEDGLTSTVSDGLGHEQNCLGSSYHTT